MSKETPDECDQKPEVEALLCDTQLLARVVDQVPTGIVITDATGRIVNANPEAERILGLERADMVSRTYRDPDWRITAPGGGPFPDENLPIARALCARGAVYGVEHCIEWSDGSHVHLSVNAAPVFGTDGEIEGAVAVVSDITQMRRITENLNRANRALRMLGECGRALAESSTERELMDAICRIVVGCGYRLAWIGLGEDDEVRTVVPAAQMGFEEGYLSALRITWADTERGRDPAGTAIRTGQPVVCSNIQGDERFAPWREQALQRGYASLMAVPLRDADGRTFGALSIYAPCPDAFDSDEASLCVQMGDELAFGITALRAQEERRIAELEIATRERSYRATLEQAVDERTMQLHATIATLTEASETKSRFVENMSHELRTPLNSVIGFSDLLLKELAGPINDEQRLQLHMIHDSGAHLLELITDVLDLSAIESGELSSNPGVFSARYLAIRVIDEVAPKAAERGLALTLEDGPDVCACADALRVRQVLSNLLANAIKFTASGSVTVRVREEGGCAVFAITDTGRGIHPDDIERIFEPFTQVSTLDEGRAPGTGLGLSISRRLADLLHGSLTVTSELSEGSTFTLTIPIDVPVAPTGQVSATESRTDEQDVSF